MIIRGRDIKLTEKQVSELEYLKKIAGDKIFFAEFLANLYDCNTKCNIRACTRYIAGESDRKLENAFNLMLDLSRRGIESHEVLSENFLKSIMKSFKLGSFQYS
jgi:hypothetical protein